MVGALTVFSQNEDLKEESKILHVIKNSFIGIDSEVLEIFQASVNHREESRKKIFLSIRYVRSTPKKFTDAYFTHRDLSIDISASSVGCEIEP